jgi:hypothetical protein
MVCFKKFIFDSATRILYEPDGTFLKKVYCPYTLPNELTISFDQKNQYGTCSHCKDVILNIDALDAREIIDGVRDNLNACVHGSADSERVIFLDGRTKNLEADEPVKQGDPLRIETARTIEDMNRAVDRGFWPDVRLVTFDIELIQSKFSVGQDQKSGKVAITGDYRYPFPRALPSASTRSDAEENTWVEVIPFTHHYRHYQNLPVAAYLIPNGLSDGTRLIVSDPIEDIQGNSWGRAEDVPGYIKDGRVVLEPEKVKVRYFVG